MGVQGDRIREAEGETEKHSDKGGIERQRGTEKEKDKERPKLKRRDNGMNRGKKSNMKKQRKQNQTFLTQFLNFWAIYLDIPLIYEIP